MDLRDYNAAGIETRPTIQRCTTNSTATLSSELLPRQNRATYESVTLITRPARDSIFYLAIF